MAATTIKVPTDLRDRLNERARAGGVTAAQVIEQALALVEREELFASMRAARARMSPSQRADYDAETRIVDGAIADGLEPEDFTAWTDDSSAKA